jgi:hypothetical protein
MSHYSSIQPLVQAPTLETQGQAMGIRTIRNAPARQQRQQYKNIIRTPTGKNRHTGIRQQELAKKACQQKEEKDIYTFSTNFNIHKIKNFNILNIQYLIRFATQRITQKPYIQHTPNVYTLASVGRVA